MILSIPDSNGRYYLWPALDMWTDVFAAPGWRTTGTKAGEYAYTPPGWDGKLPEGVARVDAPTPYIWVIGRTQTNGEKDYDAVHKFQDGMKLTPLSQWGKSWLKASAGKVDSTVDMKTPPLKQVENMVRPAVLCVWRQADEASPAESHGLQPGRTSGAHRNRAGRGLQLWQTRDIDPPGDRQSAPPLLWSR